MRAIDKSNNITEVEFTRFRRSYVKELLEVGDDPKRRQKAAQKLITYLCERYDIPKCKVYVFLEPQPCKKNDRGRITWKLEATYSFGTHFIRIFNLTAAKEKPVAIRVFLDSLLHEFMHHYDVTYLHIRSTPHCVGFYKRISDLKTKLQKTKLQ